MNILFITDLYPVTSGEVTTPRTLFDFVKEWQNSGHGVRVIKPNFILNSFIRQKPFYKTGWYGEVFNANYFLPFLGDVKSKLKDFYLQEFKPDKVVAHMPSGILFADKLGLPFVAGVHCSDLEVLTNPAYSVHFKPRLLQALRRAEKISCRSFVLREKLLKLYPEFEEKCFVAPSGVDERFIVNVDKTFERGQKLKVVTCANFKKRKNIDKVIMGVKGLENIELTVIGDGKIRPELERLDDRVKFLGRLKNDEVLEVMRGQDVFILPSIGETFGMVYLEAMASGCITVCAKGEAVDGIIKNGVNGFTVEPSSADIRNFFTALGYFEGEILNRVRKNSLATVKDYTRNTCAKNYLERL